MMAKNGTSCDDITVVVMIDGIEKMHKSMVGFFEETNKSNETFIDEEGVGDYEDWSKKLS